MYYLFSKNEKKKVFFHFTEKKIVTARAPPSN